MPPPELKNTYDEVPYESHAYPQTHPRQMATVARIFGLNPPAPAKARILEIGCAAGGNLIPIAAAAPDCHCAGIDFSSGQIEDGRAFLSSTGLKNVRLEHMSIADVTPYFGKFDYIICHGVFSWVPYEVQEHILRVCSENLTPRGLAYISYNTLPGWGAVRSIRDMMVYHTSQFSDPAKKVQEAINMLLFVSNGLPENDNWRRTIEQEIKTLETSGNSWYLYHEHLDNENNPIYFHELMSRANAHELRYVGESSGLPLMFVNNLAPSIANKLAQITDMIRQQQYMDFVRNRRFRMTVLAHADQPVNYRVPPERIFDFHLTSILAPDFDPKEQNWSSDIERTFGNKAVITRDSLSALPLTLLYENGDHPISAKALIQETAKKLGINDLQKLRTLWGDLAVKLVFFGHLILHDGPYGDLATVSEKPVVWALARVQAEQNRPVTTLRHKTIKFDEAMRLLIPLLDGSKRPSELVDTFIDKLVAVGANFMYLGHAVDPKRRRDIAIEQIEACLKTCCTHHLLVG
jgi:methyltransferase-like protein/ubiquinone/menaquinone biosynthesis C-methylase UbiE